MATKDTGQSFDGMTRRTFLKTAAVAGAAASCGFELAYNAEKAAAYENSALYKVTTTTCPYCSASCGQRVVTDVATSKVVDIYGDFESPMNSGGLCAKGAGSIQLVNNTRRIGAWTTPHPVNPVFQADGTIQWCGLQADGQRCLDRDGACRPRSARSRPAWSRLAARVTDAGGYNSKGVAFLGSSHMNNEPNYIYRKMIANFGTSNTEHQARI